MSRENNYIFISKRCYSKQFKIKLETREEANERRQRQIRFFRLAHITHDNKERRRKQISESWKLFWDTNSSIMDDIDFSVNSTLDDLETYSVGNEDTIYE